MLSREAVCHPVVTGIGREYELCKLTVAAGFMCLDHGVQCKRPAVVGLDFLLRVHGVSGRALGSRAGEIVELKYVSGGISSSGNGVGALRILAVRKDRE